jgi:4-aminobutyrate aminotransferase-like enzyme
MVAHRRLVEPVLKSGGFQHGYTYAGNPLACAAGVAVLSELDRLGAIENAAAMGHYLRGQLERVAGRYLFIGGVRGKGLLVGADLVGDRRSFAPLPKSLNATARLLALAYERGLILYGRRVRGDGAELDNIILAPPLIITREEVDEMVAILDTSLAALAREFDLPVGV